MKNMLNSTAKTLGLIMGITFPFPNTRIMKRVPDFGFEIICESFRRYYV